GLATIAARTVRAGEIIPSMAWSKTPDGDGEVNKSSGVAVRGSIVPMVASQIGFGYRKSDLFDHQVESTQWPVTASLWLKPMPMFYMGGGGGWYKQHLPQPPTPAPR